MLQLSITPIVTEKSTLDAVNGKYHFYVPHNATKIDVEKHMEAIYSQKVESVRMINTHEKTRSTNKGKAMVKRKAKKKAIVTFLTKEPIDINKTK